MYEDIIQKLLDPQNEQHKSLFKGFWAFYEPHLDDLNEELHEYSLQNEALRPFVELLDEAQRQAQNERSRALTKAALTEGAWLEYTEDLATQGKMYADLGMEVASWFDVVVVFRRLLQPRIVQSTTDSDAIVRLLDALTIFVDFAMAVIMQAYLDAKEAVIHAQSESIHQISTPVLSVYEGVLLIPLVGALDTERALMMTEKLLYAIRDQRATLAVIDIAGVATVDSRVAHHLLETVTAAQLMGSRVILTGLSPEIAQTLVALGVNLGHVQTTSDLRSGLELARASQRKVS